MCVRYCLSVCQLYSSFISLTHEQSFICSFLVYNTSFSIAIIYASFFNIYIQVKKYPIPFDLQGIEYQNTILFVDDILSYILYFLKEKCYLISNSIISHNFFFLLFYYKLIQHTLESFLLGLEFCVLTPLPLNGSIF